MKHNENQSMPQKDSADALDGATEKKGSTVNRRELLQTGFVAFLATSFGLYLVNAKNKFIDKINSGKTAYVRPPGAIAEDDFTTKCIRCNQCSDVCENSCIKFVQGGYENGTPYIVPREKACILCMRCTNTCPSGALAPIKDDSEEILDKVNMGIAKVDKNICNSYNGGVCGVCIRACPFPEIALKTGSWEQPMVDEDKCVGCGLCENRCIVYPQAIRVTPALRT